MNIISFSSPVISNFIVKIINALCTATSVAGGVVLFTLILKAITLPFDFVSRASMRKNSIKMEEMRPELEKLQKQYADQKDLYNQKMMALYKKNGYSMFGACLPTIITLVIFIVAINGFTSYSKYQNLKYFYNMTVSYNNVIYSGMDLDNNYIIRDDNGVIVIKDEELINKTTFTPENCDFEITVNKDAEFYTVKTTNSFVVYKRYYNENNGVYNFGGIEYSINESNLTKDNPLASSENNFLKDGEGKYFNETAFDSAEKFIIDIREVASANTYRSNKNSFLWVKNIWITDSPMNHPIESYTKFSQSNGATGCSACNCSGCGNENYEVITEANYNILTSKLENEKNSPNGYFILVVLTALSSLLTQFITGKSQKAQMDLQTVDGQGAQQQKMMMWMMPIMMAIFAFMYTAAFSIYIILSSVISLLTTLAINFIVDAKYKSNGSSDNGEEKVRSVSKKKYDPEEENRKKAEEKKKKENKIPDNDFLSGKADKKKHYRGRIK